MINGLRAYWRGLRHLGGYGYIYVWANLAFVLLSVPVITMPAAWAGLCKLSYYAIRQPNANGDDFISGVKEHLGRGVLMAIVNAVIFGINAANLLTLEGQSIQTWALRVLWVGVTVVWFSIQFYLYPLYYAMESPSIGGALRNALVMVLINPLFTLGIWIGLILLWSVSSILFAMWGLLTFSAMAIIANTAVQDRIRKAGFDQASDKPSEISDEIFYGTH